MVVKSELEHLGLHYTTVDLGEVEIRENITPEQLQILNNALRKSGLELLEDKKGILVEKIQAAIIELVHYFAEDTRLSHSEYLCNKLNYSYSYLAAVFTEVNGTTIEKYFLSQKTEKVKELLVYNGLSLSEIAYQLQYSSVAHLSNQFKKMTGLTPSHFKQLKLQRQTTPDGMRMK
jgi:AraC-like DNA-binding protein